MQCSLQTCVVCLQELEGLKEKTAELLSCQLTGLPEVQAADVVSPTPVSCCNAFFLVEHLTQTPPPPPSQSA